METQKTVTEERGCPVVMTLDAGGTNLVFSAIRGGEEIVAPVVCPTVADDLEACLQRIASGFEQVRRLLSEPPAAISFAFPGPADYRAGVIGDLPNFPAFRGGVALGPFLEHRFGIPVFINNDGNLFAYGEALSGVLPAVNARLAAAGNPQRYRNLIGVTLGTGFGGGIVTDRELQCGDNQVGGYLWCLPNKLYPGMIAEESVSIRGVRRVYARLSGDPATLTPKEICEIAEGARPGNREAAAVAFAELGEVAGYAISLAVTLVDGLVVIGGGLAGASKYILPSLMKELRSETGLLDGSRFDRLPVRPYNLEDPEELAAFLTPATCRVAVPGSDVQVDYRMCRRVGIALSKRGASRSIALGAYWFAVHELEKREHK